ncbi:MAG: hypothetical protein IJU86_02550 [Firmicutes bacterium]|nr:hypothetical protein [Bacillota bacterium]
MSEKDELNTAKLDINLSDIDLKNNKLDTFLQGAYDKTVAVSHNNNCTFHSMGRNVLEMYLEDEKNNIKNGLGERIIKKLIQKHGNKLENPVWADAGKHPFGSFAYRKSFLESVKYYFSNATWGWFNLINPFFWLSELIWGEYENDFYSINTENKTKLHIDKNLRDDDKYRIGNILGQLIREEIADVMRKSKNKDTSNIDLQEKTINDFGDFVDLNKGIGNKEGDETKQLKVIEQSKPETLYKNKMVQCLGDRYLPGKFDAPYVNQGSQSIILEWQYLTSNDFLEDKGSENQNNNGPAKAIILEVNQYPISFTSAKIVLINNEQPETLSFDNNKADIEKILRNLRNDSPKNLICVIGKGYFIGRCQPVSINKQKDFVAQLLNCINMPDPGFLKDKNGVELQQPQLIVEENKNI